MGINMRVSKEFFSDDEMKCQGKTCGCGNKVILDPVFDTMLLKLRVTLGLPMRVNSGCRCVKHNEKVGGAKRSFHISDEPAWEGLQGSAAVDVPYTDETFRNNLARVAWALGFRIGYHRNFLHLDSAAHHKILPQTIFKYAVVSDAELAEFKKKIINAR